jgi:CHAD domain-containing protein
MPEQRDAGPTRHQLLRMDYAVFAIAQATRLLERLSFHINRAAAAQTPDAVHDLRVAVRRFTQALVLGKSCFVSRAVKKIRRRLRTIMTLAGTVRDYDIAVKLVTRSKAEDAAAVNGKLRAHRTEARKILAASLQQWNSRNSPSKWCHALEAKASIAEFKPTTVEDVARRKLPRLAEAVFREGHRAASPEASAEQLHKCRLAAKKFRYTVELFAELYGPDAGVWVEQLKATQNLLGSISDCAMTRRLVEDMGASDRIIADLKDRQHRKTRQFRKAWVEKLGSAETSHRWVHALHHPPHKPKARAAAQGHSS